MTEGGRRSPTELFEAISRAYRSGDFEAALELIDPEIEWVEAPELPGSGTHHGHAGVQDSLRRFVGAWTEYRVAHSDLTEVGDRLFLHTRITGKGRTSGAPAEQDQFEVWTFRDGKAIVMRAFYDEGEARKAAGLEPARQETR
jgi:ketosteroid isomerase-like protein